MPALRKVYTKRANRRVPSGSGHTGIDPTTSATRQYASRAAVSSGFRGRRPGTGLPRRPSSSPLAIWLAWKALSQRYRPRDNQAPADTGQARTAAPRQSTLICSAGDSKGLSPPTRVSCRTAPQPLQPPSPPPLPRWARSFECLKKQPSHGAGGGL